MIGPARWPAGLPATSSTSSAPPSWGERGGIRAPARQLGVAGQVETATGPQQRGPGVGAGQVGRRLREQAGQDAAAHIARRIEAATKARAPPLAGRRAPW